jgi:hypothetical protein
LWLEEIEQMTGNASRAMFENCDGSATNLICVPVNTRDSMHFSCEFDSNKIDESDLQWEKQDQQRISSFHEMTIETSEEEQETEDSMRFSCEFDSNEAGQNDLQ